MFESLSTPDNYAPYRVYELLQEREHGEVIEMLGDYSVIINSRSEHEPWIGVTAMNNIDIDRIDQHFPDYIWKIHETEPPTFYQVQPDGRTYTGRHPSTRVDSLLIHVATLVEQKKEISGNSSQKVHKQYNQLISKLINCSRYKQQKRRDIWE